MRKDQTPKIKFMIYRGKDDMWYVRESRGRKILGDAGEGYQRWQKARQMIRNKVNSIRKAGAYIIVDLAGREPLTETI